MLKNHQAFAESYLSKQFFDLPKNLDQLLDTKEKLKRNIENFWQMSQETIERNQVTFRNKGGIPIHTSGSMAKPFRYLVSKNNFYKQEITHHYYHVLSEFNLEQKPIMLLRVSKIKNTTNSSRINYKNCTFFYKTFKPPSANYFYSHGGYKTICHFFQYHPKHTLQFCEFLTEFLKKNNIDVFLTSFSFVSILHETSKPEKICNLLSSICESPNFETVNSLLKNQQINSFCDHMRCWDGGFGFYDCKHGTKHIYEQYIDSKCENGKIISTDYFNFNSSFVNYWNKDTGYIANDWKKCNCGKWYREFKLDSNRKSFNLGKMTSIELHDQISKIDNTIQAVCYDKYINIITNQEISEQKKQELQQNIPLPLIFSLGNFQFIGRFDKMLRIVDRRKNGRQTNSGN